MSADGKMRMCEEHLTTQHQVLTRQAQTIKHDFSRQRQTLCK